MRRRRLTGMLRLTGSTGLAGMAGLAGLAGVTRLARELRLSRLPWSTWLAASRLARELLARLTGAPRLTRASRTTGVTRLP